MSEVLLHISHSLINSVNGVLLLLFCFFKLIITPLPDRFPSTLVTGSLPWSRLWAFVSIFFCMCVHIPVLVMKMEEVFNESRRSVHGGGGGGDGPVFIRCDQINR